MPAHLLELHSDYKPVPLDVQVDSLGWHGNAILVRKSAEILQHGILHIPYLEPRGAVSAQVRSEEHTSELQSLMRISYAVFCLKKQQHKETPMNTYTHIV